MSLIEVLRGAVGAHAVVPGTEAEPRHFGDWAVSMHQGQLPAAVVYPTSSAEVAAVLRTCNEHGIAVVPQGGLTGLLGGATPSEGSVALSLSRMRRIEAVDVAGATLTAEAGAPLQSIQEAADAAGLLFGLDIGSRGTCTIGGNASTNAGGNRVLRYGMARDMILGLEVVLADGTILSSLNTMLKNNAGYDLKQIFIGSEGTLGVITKVVVRLHPKPSSLATAFVALPSHAALLEFLGRARRDLASTLAAFEALWPDFYHLTIHDHGCRAPLPEGAACYVLMEAMGTDQARDDAAFAALIEQALEDGIASDAVIAQNLREGRELWSLRDSVAEFPRSFPHTGFDVSVPIATVETFMEDARRAIDALHQGLPMLWFGHLADSNLHICVRLQDDGPSKKAIDGAIYGCVKAVGGSVSAEHGIGLLKMPYLGYTRSPAEMDAMRRLKSAFDPKGIMNPGKVF
jgi:FAD/FMN-containing dehydrogenase